MKTPTKKKDWTTGFENYVKVVPINAESWKVEIDLPFLEMSDDILPKILRTAKQKISSRHNFPLGLLYYKDLTEKKIKSDSVHVTAKIIRGEAEKGESKLRFMKARSSQGIEYEDMILYLDLYPLKELGEALESNEIWKLIANAGLDEDKVDIEAVEGAIKTLQTDMVPVKNVLISRGRFPEAGRDAEVEFLVKLNKRDKGVYVGAERIEPLTLICRKTPLVKSTSVGYTVKGLTLDPVEPLDIKLIAGKGVRLMKDLTEIQAAKRGITKILEEQSIDPSMKSKIAISVEPIEVMDGKETVKITTDRHVEVVGGLKSGSEIISKGEVIVAGDIEENSSIVASGNINVSGKIKGGTLATEKDIYSEGEVHSSNLMAHGTLSIKGTVYDSELMGNNLISEKLVGCKVRVGKRAMIDTISADEKGLTALISAGLMNHLQDKIKENQKFIHFARTNLKRIGEILGARIVKECTPANVSRMMVIHAKDLKKEGVHRIPPEQMKPLKNLMKTIGPIRDFMEEKNMANTLFMEQIEHDKRSNPEIVINSGVEAPVKIEIDGAESEINPEDGAVSLKEKDGEVIKEAVEKDDE